MSELSIRLNAGFMKRIVLKSYGWVHSTLLAGIRRLPISSKTLGPPKGIIHDMQRWVADYKAAHPDAECWYRKVHDAVNVRHNPPRSIEDLPPVFLDEQEARQPEVFVASLPQPRLLPQSGIVIAPDDRVFEQSCSWMSFFFTRDIEFNTLRQKLNPTPLPGSYVTLISRQASSYYHWFTECLLRLCVADSLPQAPILLQKGLRQWQRESLTLLGISGERLVELEDGCYEVDQLYFPSFSGYATFTTDWTFSWNDWTLQRLREKFCGQRAINDDKRIYISREGVAHRRIVNEEAVMRALEREGCQIVEGSRLSISEKIELLGDASLIIGAHGAGLTNCLFAPMGAKVVEALDPVHLVGSYYQMAAGLGQDYWYLFSENQAVKSGEHSRKGFDDLVIDTELLLRTVEAASAS